MSCVVDINYWYRQFGPLIIASEPELTQLIFVIVSFGITGSTRRNVNKGVDYPFFAVIIVYLL